MIPAGQIPTWRDVTEAFREHHIPQALIDRKREEFCSFTQGNMAVDAYSREFENLARYAAEEVSTDAKKQERFMEGLNDEMSVQLMVATFNNYQELVDRALMIERKHQQIESRKRKYGQGKYNSGAQQRPRFTPNSGGPFQHKPWRSQSPGREFAQP